MDLPNSLHRGSKPIPPKSSNPRTEEFLAWKKGEGSNTNVEKSAPSFKHMLLTSVTNATQQDHLQNPCLDIEMHEEHPEKDAMGEGAGITLTKDERKRFYKPWSYSVILKIVGEGDKSYLSQM